MHAYCIEVKLESREGSFYSLAVKKLITGGVFTSRAPKREHCLDRSTTGLHGAVYNRPSQSGKPNTSAYGSVDTIVHPVELTGRPPPLDRSQMLLQCWQGAGLGYGLGEVR